MGTRVYQYGLMPPTDNAELVREQMSKAHRYRNRLVEIERNRRAAVRAIDQQCGDIPVLEQNVRALDEAVKHIASEIKAKRADTRSRSDSKAQREGLKNARGHLQEARRNLYAARKRLKDDPIIAEQLAAINGEKNAESAGKRDNSKKNNGSAAVARREARAASGVFWGTYLLTEAAAQASFGETPMYEGVEPKDPSFKRWDGSARVGIQIQGGMLAKDLFGSDTRVRVGSIDERAWLQETPRGERKRLSHTTLQLRIGSEGRDPIFASWEMIMHRRIPDDAVVKWVAVSCRREGPREHWTCEITVDEPAQQHAGDTASGAVAVVFGFARTAEGIRVARWLSDAGEAGEVVIGTHGLDRVDVDGGKGGIASGVQKAEEIRSVRDKGLTEALDNLCGWLREHDMPDWMRARTVRKSDALPSKKQAIAYLLGWRSQARLAALVRFWVSNRFDGDTDAFVAAEVWRYHDFHLWQWESAQRGGALRRRDNHYRNVSAMFAGKFSRLLIDGARFDEIAKRAPVEAAKGEAKTPRSDRQLAAPGELRSSMKNAALGRGRMWEVVAPSLTACTCPACGSVDEAQRDNHQFACVKCPLVRDKDMVRLLNTMKAGGLNKQVAEIIHRQEEVLASLRDAAE